MKCKQISFWNELYYHIKWIVVDKVGLYLTWSCRTGLINSSVLQGWSIKKGWPSRGCSWKTHRHDWCFMFTVGKLGRWLHLLPVDWWCWDDSSEEKVLNWDAQISTYPLMTGSSPLSQTVNNGEFIWVFRYITGTKHLLLHYQCK